MHQSDADPDNLVHQLYFCSGESARQALLEEIATALERSYGITAEALGAHLAGRSGLGVRAACGVDDTVGNFSQAIGSELAGFRENLRNAAESLHRARGRFQTDTRTGLVYDQRMNCWLTPTEAKLERLLVLREQASAERAWDALLAAGVPDRMPAHWSTEPAHE